MLDLTYAVQICLVVGGLLASLWISPLFLIFSFAGLFLMGALYQAVKVYEQTQE